MDAAARHRQDLKNRILDGVENDYFKLQAEYVRRFGSSAGIFARQLFFWDGKGETPGGWIYKSQSEWAKETGLSVRQQKKARKVLLAKGVMEEDTRPNPRNGWRPQLYYRLDLEALSEALGISSPTGISDRSSPTGISDRCSPTDTTVRTSESATNVSSNENAVTERAYTENTSESSPKSLQRLPAGEDALQASVNQGFPDVLGERTEENEGVEQDEGHVLERSAKLTPIFQDTQKGGQPKGPLVRPDALEINQIYKLLTDEQRYPKCYGVYRAYREDKLSFDRLLEAVCYALTDGYEDAERYRETLEGMDRLLREEEEIA